MDCSRPGFPVLHYLPEFAQTYVRWVNDAIQRSHPLLPPSPPALNLSQHQVFDGGAEIVVLEKSPLDSKEIKPIIKEINPEYSLEGLMLKLKLQYFCPDTKNWLIGKDHDTGKDLRWEEKGRQGMRMLDGIIDSMDISLSQL